MRYWIIGGNGFVGRYLSKELAGMSRAVCVCDLADEIDSRIPGDKSDTPVEYYKVDVRDKESLRALPIAPEDVVVNLAANQYHTKVPSDRKTYFYSVNTAGTQNLLEVMAEKGCMQFLMLTTDMTYGKPQYLPVDITHPQNPFGPYGQSKKECESLCFEYRKRGMNITIFRPRMIMGPGRLGILVKLFKLIDYNLPVPTIGNGKNHYQMISVFDCVSAIIAAIDKGLPNREYNLGSANPPSIRTLLKGLIKSAGKHSVVVPTPGSLVKGCLRLLDNMHLTLMYPEQFMIADEEYILDISDTERDLDWHPKYNDADMIAQAYSIYKSR